MTPLRIVLAGDPVLREDARRLSAEDLATPQVRALIQAMIVAMRDAPGVGLAAPQVGVGVALIVLEDAESLMARLSPEQRLERERVPVPLRVIANPKLEFEGEKTATFYEGCLSVPGYMARVTRAHKVTVTGLDAQGAPVRWTVSGWPARILQHEVDHTHGTLYVDRMDSRTLATHEEALSRLVAKG